MPCEDLQMEMGRKGVARQELMKGRAGQERGGGVGSEGRVVPYIAG